MNGKFGRVKDANLYEGLLEGFLNFIGNPGIKLVPRSGREILPKSGAPRATVRIKSPRTVGKLVFNPFLQVGDAYSNGEIEIDGELLPLLEELFGRFVETNGDSGMVNRWSNFINKPRVNSLTGSRNNISSHYDIGNDFYKLWLDERMVYSCAFFREDSMTLEQAQFAKLDLICCKLRLKPGQTVLEIGSGWGAMALHMAKHYGVKVCAYNISNEQLEWSRDLAKREGLSSLVEFVEDDYRNVTGTFDAFVSVGMLEHVGRDNLGDFGKVLKRTLSPGGLGLMQSIGKTRPGPLGVWFERRIFPGAYIPALSEMCELFEPNNLAIHDVENLRLHYARTLTHWLERYEANIDTVRAMYDENFVRMWRLYLTASIASFTSGFTQLYQVLFSHTGNRNAPMRRDYLLKP
jgi:cyclopropane-fatty-acyl-phospholipid synthase